MKLMTLVQKPSAQITSKRGLILSQNQSVPKRLLLSLVAAPLLLLTTPALASTPIEFQFHPPSVKQAMDTRDENMAFKCTVEMFDCDGTRKKEREERLLGKNNENVTAIVDVFGGKL